MVAMKSTDYHNYDKDNEQMYFKIKKLHIADTHTCMQVYNTRVEQMKRSLNVPSLCL